ncbi:MAG: uncharacterized protein QOE14_1218 [Humisphaera sp.]|nr:uncharacterized protein [Humisphaera sp.]
MLTIVLLLISNVFMTFAWYGHLKHKGAPLVLAILVSWGIAFFEYCFMVPANRIGSNTFTTTQLKVIQEVITLVVFTGFSLLYLKEQMKWNYLVGFGFILLAVFFVFHDFSGTKAPTPTTPTPMVAQKAE